MLRLRADPWMPEYGMGFDVRFDEPPATVEPFLETNDWSTARRGDAAHAEAVYFIDGVRRIELRLLADVDGRRVPGLFGSYAVGSALCDGVATFDECVIGRSLVLGGGELGERVEVRFGSGTCVFEPSSTSDPEPDGPLIALQALMRKAEEHLAARLVDKEASLLLVDGPLAFLSKTKVPVVGIIKRFGRVYLEPEQGQLIPRLGAGERTPIFAIEGSAGRRRRYAWYARLTPVRPPWHDHSGVVRCEVGGGMPVVDAQGLADRVTALLPQFAGRASDPRTPQNLVPVAGLETWLRHRIGDSRLIRRALLERLALEAAA